MPRNFSELKSGGTIPMLSPHPEKWRGGGASPPRPPPIDARGGKALVAQKVSTTTSPLGTSHHSVNAECCPRVQNIGHRSVTTYHWCF